MKKVVIITSFLSGANTALAMSSEPFNCSPFNAIVTPQMVHEALQTEHLADVEYAISSFKSLDCNEQEEVLKAMEVKPLFALVRDYRQKKRQKCAALVVGATAIILGSFGSIAWGKVSGDDYWYGKLAVGLAGSANGLLGVAAWQISGTPFCTPRIDQRLLELLQVYLPKNTVLSELETGFFV